MHIRGEILRPPENSVPQTIVFRNKDIVDKLCGKQRKKVMFLSKYSLDRNNTIASLFRTQYTRRYYSLRNTIFLMTKDLALGWDDVGTRAKVRWIYRYVAFH
jgi:hypothetical protein